jgi:hypothetical protein
VFGRHERILAVLFADPLYSPAPPNRGNKILWLSRLPQTPGSSLRISAQRMRGAAVLGSPWRHTVAGGAGPSLVNFPAAGCWRLTLRWSGRSDTLDLTVEPLR